jgi:hypothetical protein
MFSRSSRKSAFISFAIRALNVDVTVNHNDNVMCGEEDVVDSLITNTTRLLNQNASGQIHPRQSNI